jgi:hypothetical protein
MNAPASITQRDINASHQSAAFFSLSQTQRRLAHDYKRWALEDAGRWLPDELYRKHRAESDRLWQSAKWNLQAARRAAQ